MLNLGVRIVANPNALVTHDDNSCGNSVSVRPLRAASLERKRARFTPLGLRPKMECVFSVTLNFYSNSIWRPEIEKALSHRNCHQRKRCAKTSSFSPWFCAPKPNAFPRFFMVDLYLVIQFLGASQDFSHTSNSVHSLCRRQHVDWRDIRQITPPRARLRNPENTLRAITITLHGENRSRPRGRFKT